MESSATNTSGALREVRQHVFTQGKPDVRFVFMYFNVESKVRALRKFQWHFQSNCCFLSECGDRLNVRDIVILASDGASTLEKELIETESQRLADLGIRTFAIGKLLNVSA